MELLEQNIQYLWLHNLGSANDVILLKYIAVLFLDFNKIIQKGGLHMYHKDKISFGTELKKHITRMVSFHTI